MASGSGIVCGSLAISAPSLEKGSDSVSDTPSGPHVTIGAFPKASFLPREMAVDPPWMGALKNWVW